MYESDESSLMMVNIVALSILSDIHSTEELPKIRVHEEP